MLTSNPEYFRGATLLSVLLVVLGIISGRLLPGSEWVLFGAVMCLTGIPHGATDHIIHQQLAAEEGKRFVWSRFIATYLAALAAYALMWWKFPGLSLVVFLLVSAFHFGQSQFIYLRWAQNGISSRLLSLIWGMMVLYALFLLHWNQTIDLISTLIPASEVLKSLPPFALWGALVLQFVVVGILLYRAKSSGAITSDELSREMALIAILMILFYFGGLWIGFAVYFGIWHSVSSMLAEKTILSRIHSFTWKSFVLSAWPISAISIIGIAIVLAAQILSGITTPAVFQFFIAISTLTLPHALGMDQFYIKFETALRRPEPLKQ